MARANEDTSRIPTPAKLLQGLATKKEISDAIELLIARLDAMDGDCDFEDDEIEVEDTDENENEPYCGCARDYWEAQV